MEILVAVRGPAAAGGAGARHRHGPIGIEGRIATGIRAVGRVEKVASITLRAEADRLHLSYRVRALGGEWQDVDEAVHIIRVPCRFGGARAYFTCPGVINGVSCARHVAKLYGAGRYFVCRHCYRLSLCQPERGRMGSSGPACQQN
jgi:hypothetical protein